MQFFKNDTRRIENFIKKEYSCSKLSDVAKEHNVLLSLSNRKRDIGIIDSDNFIVPVRTDSYKTVKFHVPQIHHVTQFTISYDEPDEGIKAIVDYNTRELGKGLEMFLFDQLEAFIPTYTPTAGDMFCGVDRSVNPRMLAGDYMSCTSLNASDIIDTTVTKLANESHTANRLMCLMTYSKLASLIKSGIERLPVTIERTMAFEVFTAIGSLLCVPCRSCPDDRMFMLTYKDCIYYDYLGDLVNMFRIDDICGIEKERTATFRLFSIGAMTIDAPSSCTTIVVSK